MEYNKKVGIVLMVASPLFAIFSFFISDAEDSVIYHNGYFNSLFNGWLRVRFFQSQVMGVGEYISHTEYLIDIPTKFVLLLCLAIFALGLLYFLKVLNAPRKLISNKITNTPDN